MTLQFAGLEVIIGSWPSLLALLPMLVALPMRIREEESLLVEHFGSAYLVYRSRVPALLPRVGRVRRA